MIPGVEVQIGDTKYTLPPINIALRRAHKEFLARALKFYDGSAMPTNEDVLEIAQIVSGALKRNYPEIDFGEIEAHLEDGKLLECFVAVMTAGLAGPKPGEARPGSR